MITVTEVLVAAQKIIEEFAKEVERMRDTAPRYCSKPVWNRS